MGRLIPNWPALIFFLNWYAAASLEVKMAVPLP
jgi:hypothetical protein